MQEDWMTSKSKKMGEMVKVAPYIEQGEYKKYLITHEQDVCETRQFGFYACSITVTPRIFAIATILLDKIEG
jgi:hypothetical protein